MNPIVLYTQNFCSLLFSTKTRKIEMFVRMLTVNCDQNSSSEIIINGFQVRKINEIRNVIFGLQLWETFLSLEGEVGMFTKLST